jgi:hypothetical protein
VLPRPLTMYVQKVLNVCTTGLEEKECCGKKLNQISPPQFPRSVTSTNSRSRMWLASKGEFSQEVSAILLSCRMQAILACT